MKTDVQLPESAQGVVVAFADTLREIAPNELEGIYLTGSLTMDDFHPAKSDIDFLVLCKAMPDAALATKLLQMHKQLHRRFPGPLLSGMYVPSDTLNAAQPEAERVLTWHKGRLRQAAFDMAPVTLVEMQRSAITLHGLPAQSLPICIAPDSLEAFLQRNMVTYWTRWINRYGSWLNRRMLLALFPSLTEWTVLGIARQFCTLQTGRIVSKTEAGLYCLENLPQQFHPILHEAVRIRRDERNLPFVRSHTLRPSVRRAARVVEFARYIIAFFREHAETNKRDRSTPISQP